MRPKQKVETFPDGVVAVYQPADGRKVGRRKCILRFEEQSVGINRYYQAQASAGTDRIDRVIKVPRTELVSAQDIAVVLTDGKQYRIKRIQVKPERGVSLWELQSVQVSIEIEEEDKNANHSD